MNRFSDNPAFDNSSWPATEGVKCDDSDYIGSHPTTGGQKWKDCLSCQQKSNATDASTNQNDQYWFLCAFLHIYNIIDVLLLRSVANDAMDP